MRAAGSCCWPAPPARSGADAATTAAGELGVRLDAYRVGGGGDVADPTGRFAEVFGTGEEGAVLVRPDGFVAWRARAAQDDARDVLENVLGRVLARS